MNMPKSGIYDKTDLLCQCESGQKCKYISCEFKKLSCKECFPNGAIPYSKFYKSLQNLKEIYNPLIEDTILRLSQTQAAFQQVFDKLKKNLEEGAQIKLIDLILRQEFKHQDFSNLMNHIEIKRHESDKNSALQLELELKNNLIFEKIDQQIKILNQFYMDNFWSIEYSQKQFDSLAIKQVLQVSGQEFLEFSQQLIVLDDKTNSLIQLNKYSFQEEFKLEFNSDELELQSILKASNEQFFIADFSKKLTYYQINQKQFTNKFSLELQEDISVLTISEDNQKIFVSLTSEIQVYQIEQTKFTKLQCSIPNEIFKGLIVPIYALSQANQLLYVANCSSNISIYDISELNQNKIQLKWELKLQLKTLNNFLYTMQNKMILFGNNCACLKQLQVVNDKLILLNLFQEKLEGDFQNYAVKDDLLVFFSKMEIKLFQICGTEMKKIESKIFKDEKIYGCKFSNCGTKLYVVGMKFYIISLYLQIKQENSQKC